MDAENFIRLERINRDTHHVHFEFSAGQSIEHLLWDARTLTLFCSEGVVSDFTRLGSTFAFAMAPLNWTYGTWIDGPYSLDPAAKEMLILQGDYLSKYYHWPPQTQTGAWSSVPSPPRRYPARHRGLFFSAGIDSSTVLAEYRNELDWLIHLTNFENLDSHTSLQQREEAMRTVSYIANLHGLALMHLRTNIPSIFKHNRLDDRFPKDCSFWLGLEHIHHLATALSIVRPPLMEVFVAGGFNELLNITGSCAANADFISLYKWPTPLSMCHEMMPRQKKVEYLMDHATYLLKNLRVCFSSGKGTCPSCRKCQATYLMVLSAGGNLKDTNFPVEIVHTTKRTVEELSQLPADGHAVFNECLTGRVLQGAREDRWKQLSTILRDEGSRLHTPQIDCDGQP